MNWIKVPVRFTKEGQPDYADLGINVDPDFEDGEMLINMDKVCSINASSDKNETILRFDGGRGENCVWVQMEYEHFVKMLIK